MVNAKIIHREPVLGSSFFQAKNNSGFFPLFDKNTFLFGFARAALHEGLKIMGIKEGENILVPSYVCNVVVAPMYRLNIKVRFYEVDSNLVPLWKDLEDKIDFKTKAMLIVNYFGFPNDLATARSLCDKHGLYLIEDNAHSFLGSDNGKPLGSTGDISLFSFRKIVPIPNGAALVVNNQLLADKSSNPGYLKRNNRDLRFIVKSLLAALKEGLQAFNRQPLKETDFEALRIKYLGEEDNVEKYFVKLSKTSYFLLRHFNLDRIREERRKTYSLWLEYFSRAKISGIKVVFPYLKDGAIPSSFPVLAANQKEFISKMWRNRIECFPWPYLPRDSREEYFSKHLVCLPVFPCFKPADYIGMQE